MARTKIIANQLDLTNSQIPMSNMFIDTYHTGITIGSTVPSPNQFLVDNYNNGIVLDAEGSTGIQLRAMYSNGITMNIGYSGGVNILDYGLANSGILFNLTGYAPIRLFTNGPIDIKTITPGISSITLESTGGINLYSYKYGITLFNDASASSSAPIIIQNNSSNGALELSAKGNVSIRTVENNLYLNASTGLFIGNSNFGSISINNTANSGGGILIENFNSGDIYITQNKIGNELTLLYSPTGSYYRIANSGGNLVLNATGWGVDLNYSFTAGMRFNGTFSGGTIFNIEGSYGFIITDSGNANHGGIKLRQYASNAGSIEIINFSPSGIWIEAGSSGNGGPITLRSNDENIYLQAYNGKLILEAGNFIEAKSDIEFYNNSNGIILKSRTGTKKFRVYINDDTGALLTEEIL